MTISVCTSQVPWNKLTQRWPWCPTGGIIHLLPPTSQNVYACGAPRTRLVLAGDEPQDSRKRLDFVHLAYITEFISHARSNRDRYPALKYVCPDCLSPEVEALFALEGVLV